MRTAEVYDPRTGTWSELAAARRERVYHNTALLLPDGRVLVGGHAPHPAHFAKHGNHATRHNNYRDATFEIFEPPYLARGDRPVIRSMALSPDRRSLHLRATAADEVVLVRLGAVTHGQDADLRAVVLEHTAGRGGRVTAALPKEGDGRLVPPGAYYVFVNRMTPEGPVPSVARTVLVEPDGAATGAVAFARL